MVKRRLALITILTYIQAHGLSMGIAAIFLAGEMAGSGVLALARAMVGTGKQNHTLL